MKKSKKIIIITMILILILAILGIILYLATDLFKSPSKLFWKYLSKQSENIETILNDRSAIQRKFKNNNTYMSNGNLSVVLKQGEESFKKLDIITASRHDANSGRTYAEAILKNGDLNIFKVSYINSENIYGIKCDDVAPVYIGIENTGLQKLAQNYEIPNFDIIPNSINIDAILEKFKLNDEQKKHIEDTYFPIIINNIPEDQYTKSEEQISIDGISYSNSKIYSVKLTGNNIKQIIMELLNNLKKDDKMLEWIHDLSVELGLEYTDTEKIKIKLQEIIDEIKSIDFEREINIYLYKNAGEIIKSKIELAGYMTLEFDNIGKKQSLSIEKTNKKKNNLAINNANSTKKNLENNIENDIIDLNEYANNDKISTTKITISREESNDKDINIIELIPDTGKEENKISIEIQKSNIKNNSFSNSYNISAKFNESNSLNILYNTNTTKTNKIEEIMELTDSNSVLANNYEANQFKKFAASWHSIFIDKFKTKLNVLGFEENFK